MPLLLPSFPIPLTITASPRLLFWCSLIQDRVRPSYDSQDQQFQLQKEAQRVLQSKKQAFSRYRYARSHDEGPTRFSGTVSHAPEARVKTTIKRLAVAPLMTLDLPYDGEDLPELEWGQADGHLEVNFEGVGQHCTESTKLSPPPPPPLPKSAVASSYDAGTTSLSSLVSQSPPPAPPSHSPDHKSKLHKFRLGLGSSRAGRSSPRSALQDPWYGDSGSASMLMPPTPLSKGLSGGSGSTYPTVSPRSTGPNQLGLGFDRAQAAQSTASASSNIHPKASMRSAAFSHRPKSAGDGMTRSQVSSSASRTFNRAFASSVTVAAARARSDRDNFITFQDTVAVPTGNGDGSFGQREHRERTQSDSCSPPLSTGSLNNPTSTSRACQGEEEASSKLSSESAAAEEKKEMSGRSFSAGSTGSAGFFKSHHRPIVASPLSGQFAVTANQSHDGHFPLRLAPEHRGRRQTDIESDEKISQAEEEIEREELHAHQQEQQDRQLKEGEEEEEDEDERLCASLPSSADARSDMSGTLNNAPECSLTQQNLSPTPSPLLPSPTPPSVVSKK